MSNLDQQQPEQKPKPGEPSCKWCGSAFELSTTGSWICTFDPMEKWNIPLSPAETQAIEEAESLLELWKVEMERQGKHICAEKFFSRQSELNRRLSETAFQRLLYSGGMICPGCYCNWSDRKNLH
jgi:hypothetical protein